MIHRDHMGHEGELFSGGVQWMTAGRGVIHEERPLPVEGLMRGFQLWINLPAAEKMKPAAYQNIAPENVPEFDLDNGVIIKVIAGSMAIEGLQMDGPISVDSTQPLYVDIQLAPFSEIVLPLPRNHNAFVYLFEGEATIGHELLSSNNAYVLSDGSGVALHTHEKSARMLLLAGKPLGEPVAQYGPFVMNTMEEVEQAIDDYRNNRLVG
jgi:redox-sensitive bicupin YhaK (pirin superfamily)